MNIKSKEEAFRVLDTVKNGIPYDAIKYLYNYGQDEEILEKVIFNIENSYNKSIFYNRRTDYYSNAPLWYCIVAEGQIDDRLIDSVIKLYTTTKRDWDFLNEQGIFLLCKLCEKYGDLVINKCMKTCVDLNKKASDLPYLFLFESLSFGEEGKYDDEILELLKNPKGKWIEALIVHLSSPKYRKLLPRLKELKEYYERIENKNTREEHTLMELEVTINEIEQDHSEDNEKLESYYKTRGNWEIYYKKFEDNFIETPIEVSRKKKKIGRNAPCPCGSGKKYKRCCYNLN